MSTICPTILAADVRTYRVQMEQAARFATRIHIDMADGSMTPNRLMGLSHIWWPAGVRADLHMMYRTPFKHVDTYLAQAPHLVIVHAEGEGDFVAFADTLHARGIKVGVALLPPTPVETIVPALSRIDHVLIFSGNIGHFGGHADLKLLTKAAQLKQLKPELEIGWDGGVNDKNAKALVDGGIAVLNAGGFIHGAKQPEKAYAALKSLIEARI